MAVKKGEQQELELDPAVSTYLSGASQSGVDETRQQETGMTAAQRRKREKDAARSKATYDLPDSIIERIEEIAKQFGDKGVPKSQLAAHLLAVAIKKVDENQINLDRYLKPSIVPRFSFFLGLPDDTNDG